MRSRLGRSVVAIANASELSSADWFGGLLEVGRISEGQEPVAPGLFAAYQDLVALISSRRLDEALAVMEEIATGDWQARSLTVRDFGDGSFSSRALERYRRYLSVDPTTPLNLRAPGKGSGAAMRQLLRKALDLLERAHPELFAEVSQIVSEIVLAIDAGRTEDQSDFSGASSFALWGAVFFNAEEHDDAAEIAQALAHEAGHLLLFAKAVDGPLVENPESERFSSPLRSDPRPMDGIFHATFVTARMHLAARSIYDRGGLPDRDRKRLHRAILTHEANFDGGVETIRQNARLTELGRDVLSGAEQYMATARIHQIRSRNPCVSIVTE
jgi:HEXXH motif-containing protein